MRRFFYLLLAAAAVYGAVRYVPRETRERALAAVGLSDFFKETLPTFLRTKLSISENPVTKRAKLLRELSSSVGEIERELEAVIPVSSDGTPTAVPLPSSREIRERIERSREFLAKSEEALAALEDANPGKSVFEKAAERILDKILPPPSEGLGGDASGGSYVCPPQ